MSVANPCGKSQGWDAYICMSKRALAVKHGAVEITLKESGRIVAARLLALKKGG